MPLNFARPTIWDSTPNDRRRRAAADGNKSGRVVLSSRLFGAQEAGLVVRKLIAFDDDTLDKLTQLARDRMATLQELADEAFADLLKKHGIPVDLKDALRKSAARPTATARTRQDPAARGRRNHGT
jgi:hypothetical protein